MWKISFIILGLILISFVGTCIYFVAGVSATGSPIKKYECNGNMNQLLTGIKKFTTYSKNVILKITDTTGGRANGISIYFDLEVKNNGSYILYNLECEKNDINDAHSKTSVQLVGAFNEKKLKIGGYSFKGIGVRKMVSDFETGFLVSLKQQEKITIIPIAN